MSFSNTLIDPVIALYYKGQFKEALKALTVLIEKHPDEPVLYNISGTCYAQIGQLGAAIESYERALKIKPDYAIAYSNLGKLLTDAGQPEAAIERYKQALKIKPDSAETHNNLSKALKDAGKLEESVESCRRAIHIKPDYAEAYYNLGTALRDAGQLVEATKSYRQAIHIKPDYAEAYNNLGTTLRDTGHMKEATESYMRAIHIKPDYAAAHRHLSALKKYNKDDAHIHLMESLYSNSNLNNSDRIQLCFALAKANEDIGKHEELFDYLDEGNLLRREELNYTIDQSQRLFSTIKNIFSTLPPVIKAQNSNGKTIKKPVFIVGMPRSGTSLVEQILSSHAETHGAGELYFMNDIASPLLHKYFLEETGGHLKTVTEDDIHIVRNEYHKSLLTLNVSENIIIDKMPQNFLWIGFIFSAFPEAKIIHLNRDPVATCWSNYKHYYPSKGNGFTYDLNYLAKYYHLYTDLMKFWRHYFPNKIYDLYYENLTRNQEEETRKLLEYCGLDWDEQCLNFHKIKRTVQTASAAQVRQKMYQGSSDEWKKFEKYLQPLINALGY